jgi:hypothetical protein
MHTKPFLSIKAAFAYHALMCVHVVIEYITGQMQNCLLNLGIYDDGNEDIGSLKKILQGFRAMDEMDVLNTVIIPWDGSI